jgi:malonyl-CoA decarboxylase
LSPAPGFRAWLAHEGWRPDLLLPAEAKVLDGLGDLSSVLDRSEWHRDPRVAGALREPLLRLCAHYLLRERSPAGRALDPVAHFHLSNGARVERLNWLGDVSEKGLQQSAGIMVNYCYRLDDIEAHHEAYRSSGRVAAATAVRSLVWTA